MKSRSAGRGGTPCSPHPVCPVNQPTNQRPLARTSLDGLLEQLQEKGQFMDSPSSRVLVVVLGGGTAALDYGQKLESFFGLLYPSLHSEGRDPFSG